MRGHAAEARGVEGALIITESYGAYLSVFSYVTYHQLLRQATPSDNLTVNAEVSMQSVLLWAEGT